MSRIITNGLFENGQNSTSEFSRFPSTRNRDSLGESMHSSYSSGSKSLSSTITSLEDFDFFRKDSLFSDSDGDEQDDCNQEVNLGGHKSDDIQKNSFEGGNINDCITWRKGERQIGSTNNVLTRNVEACSSFSQKACHYPGGQNAAQQFMCTGNDTSEDQYDAGTPLRQTGALNSCTIDEIYETFCDGDDCLTTEPCCNNTQTTDIVYEEQRSSIHYMLTPEYSEDGGMNLYSFEQGHFIDIVDENSKYTSRMSFHHNDKILGINYQAIQSYEHDIVLEMFRYLLHPPTEESISLVVERQDESGNMIVIEIEIIAEVITRGNPAVIITADIHYSKPVKLNIKCVVMKNCYDLRIESGASTNGFVIADKRGLCVRHLKYKDENKSLFRYYIFSGLCMTSGRRAKSIFIAVFQSCDNHKFIMAASKSKLSLISTRRKLDTSVSRITRADPRFFIVYKTGNGQIYCESLLFRGSYWALTGNVLQLAKRTETEILIRNDSMFDFVTV